MIAFLLATAAWIGALMIGRFAGRPAVIPSGAATGAVPPSG